ncbi:hypothetical protein [Marimonas arenosa]|uniref:Imelysin n=1 Tax=Marimonas arenosa TaxID=1795305 RepID=A0AAE4B4V2_9RHOB|nr:hypothetical protein [Marimonas arenosa]MDQ2090620.1 hypothetical protein [Marimonas arenosa]
MTLRPVSLALALLFAPLAATAGPVADFETAYRDAYATYRKALFLTNSGDTAGSAEAAHALSDKWTALRDSWEAAPPPHYEDDPGWRDTLVQVAWLINRSSGQIVEGDLNGAHETLEGVREELAALHDRNGIESFSDRMNAYHAEMEHVLMTDLSTLDAAAIDALQERAALLHYLARDLLAAPPPEGRDNPDFDALAKTFEASVAAFLAAARAGDAEAIRKAAAGLKKPYARLFVKFG